MVDSFCLATCIEGADAGAGDWVKSKGEYHCLINFHCTCGLALMILRSITRFIEKDLRILVNQHKTAIRRPVWLELLGYGFVSSYRKGAKGKYDLRVAPKSGQRLKLKIKALTRKTSPVSLEERITLLG